MNKNRRTLTLEALDVLRGSQLGDLERDLAMELPILGEVDGTHAALAELGLDLIISDAFTDQRHPIHLRPLADRSM